MFHNILFEMSKIEEKVILQLLNLMLNGPCSLDRISIQFSKQFFSIYF